MQLKQRNNKRMTLIEKLYQLFLECKEITTDTRDCPKGSIFFALKGANFNGNSFAHKALEQGCAYAVVDESTPDMIDNEQYIVVDNVLTTLQQLANHHRRALNTTIIGITGTNGKTTTKELLATVLAQKYNVLYTLGNLNNDIGVPKTLLRLNKEHNMAVIEMGASHPGDIKTLVDIVEPNYALITNVGRAHLQGFGSFDGVKRTKAELYDFMEAHNRANNIFINAESTDLLEMFSTHCKGESYIAYSPTNSIKAPFVAEITANNPFVSFRWKETDNESNAWHNVSTHLIGAYNIANMLAAVSIGRTMGVESEDICNALENYIPSNNRSQLIKTAHNTIIMDAYNANPTSMKAALENFMKMDVEHKMVILGDMRELGEVSNSEHQKICDLLKSAQFDCVWLVGKEFMATQNEFKSFENVEQVIAELQQTAVQNFCILVKGSNGIGLACLKDVL